jgi:CHASE2 domain-containing sensor protein
MIYHPSHFAAVLLFALCASIVFGITQRETPRRMIRYGIYCFVLFVCSVIALSWGMFLIAR